MAQDQSTENAVIALTSSDKYATFDGGIQQAYLTCDTDCKVAFDQVAQSGSSLLIKANQAPIRISFGGANVKQVHAIGTSGNLYILGVRGER